MKLQKSKPWHSFTTLMMSLLISLSLSHTHTHLHSVGTRITQVITVIEADVEKVPLKLWHYFISQLFRSSCHSICEFCWSLPGTLIKECTKFKHYASLVTAHQLSDQNRSYSTVLSQTLTTAAGWHKIYGSTWVFSTGAFPPQELHFTLLKPGTFSESWRIFTTGTIV